MQNQITKNKFKGNTAIEHIQNSIFKHNDNKFGDDDDKVGFVGLSQEKPKRGGMGFGLQNHV